MKKKLGISTPLPPNPKPLFKLDKRINAWYLHSEGVGGNNIDFMKKYLNTLVNEVLDWAQKQNFSSFHHHQHIKTSEPNYTIDEILDLQNPNLKQYLQGRGLSPKVYDHIKEVRFTIGNKKLYAIGFENLSGGLELRNAFYKGSLLKKDVSLINLSINGQNISNIQDRDIKGVAVFEGFMDALSFIELQKSFAGDILVMNSIALLNKSIEHLKNYPDIHLFLDNDNAGIKCKSEIIRSFPEAKDHSGIYSNHKDLNEFLIHRIKNNVSNKKNNVSNKIGKQSEKFPQQDKQKVRGQEPKIKNSNGFKRKR